jgi:hypothetical protein
MRVAFQTPLDKEPNIAIRPNVAPRVKADIRNDSTFLKNVRGVPAIRKLLWSFGIDPGRARPDDSDVAHRLSEAQRSCLRQDVACPHCGRIPSGIDFAGNAVWIPCDPPHCRS